MPVQSNIIPARVHPDMQAERNKATFSVAEFQEWVFGGAEKLKEKREIEEELYKDLGDGHLHDYLSHEDLYNLAVKHVTDACKKLKSLQQKRNPGGNEIWPRMLYGLPSQALMPANHPFATHSTMFVDVIMGQGTPEQIEKFGKPAANCNIIGTYAQTELAHGTNVRGIETRADYDRATDEFVLNTPTLKAYKWWPGGLGHTCNHAMVVAQLYIDNAHKGIQMFIVPLRDAETHMPLPGVDIGEIGKKLGMLAVNQGFLGLKNVRIPRTNMLMKNAKVLPDGTFVESPASRLNYLTMVYTRCLIVNQDSTMLLQAATIATRYAAVRRQSTINPNEPEVQIMDHVTQQLKLLPEIMDHVTQQLKLLPEIATGIAYHLAAQYMWEMYARTLKDVADGEYSLMLPMHVLSSALKALCTTDGSEGIERLRLACGGHGYLTASNFSTIYGNAVAANTYEGENTVLLLQVGRYLIKAWLRLTEAGQPAQLVEYFGEVRRMRQPPQWNSSCECIVKVLQYVAANKTRVAFENLSRRVAEGQTQAEASNNTGIELVQAAELHGRQFVAATFLEQVTGRTAAKRSASLNAVLQNILELYLVHSALRHMNDILRFVPLTDTELRALQQRLESALKRLRPNAVSICDGFDFHDRVLNSVLGCYDGNVYERIFDAAKKSPMNQKPVPDSFEKYLKPFLKANL